METPHDNKRSPAFELLDETLREGKARGLHGSTHEAKLALVRAIHDITGTKRFCLGFGIAPRDIETLTYMLSAVEQGKLPALRWRLFATYGTADRVMQILEAMPSHHRNGIILAISCRPNEVQARAEDGPFACKQAPELTEAPWRDVAAFLQRAHSAILRSAAGFGLAEIHSIVMDAFRSDEAAVVAYVAAAVRGGASSVHLHDTVGIATPRTVVSRLTRLKEAVPGVRLGVHFHDDFGMATANSLAAIEAGAVSVDVTVNGLGNRAGNAPAAQLLLALSELCGIDMPGLRKERLIELSRAAEHHFGIAESFHAPITGRLTYIDEASFRSNLMTILGPRSYLPFDPAQVGAAIEVAYSGAVNRSSVEATLMRHRDELASKGITVDEGLVNRGYEWVTGEVVRRDTRDEYYARIEQLERFMRESYVFERDLVEQAIRTLGRFS